MDNINVLLIRGVIAGLDEQQQARVKECADKLRAIVTEYGDQGLGLMAIALVGTELQAENE